MSTGRCTRILAGIALFGATGLAASGCGDDYSDCWSSRSCRGSGNAATAGTAGESGAPNDAAGGQSGAAGSAGTPSDADGAKGDNGGESGAPASVCDTTKSPSDEPCLVSNEYAVFVSPDGIDIAPGTQDDPVQTLAHAIALARAAYKIVIACTSSGPYPELVTVDSHSDGTKLYGGFACRTWRYSSDAPSEVRSPESTALRVDGLKRGLVVEDFTFTTTAPKGAGESSLGAFVTSSKAVALSRVTIIAKAGNDGQDAVASQSAAGDGADGRDGFVACATRIPSTKPITTTCASEPARSVAGLGGGAQDTPGADGEDGENGLPSLGGGRGGSGDDGSSTWTCDVGPGLGGGEAGADGTSPLAAAGASMPPSLTPAGYVGASGADGASGTTGQGGGGGAGTRQPDRCKDTKLTVITGASGGTGGSGGCGGKGGGGGGPGGASIALAVLDSDVTLTTVELFAMNGGRGGNGAAGHVGGEGGSPGAGAAGPIVDSCPGGRGGNGGNGAAGGGGAGGHSVGIFWSGKSAPRQTDITISTGTPGAKGKGGDPGHNDGSDGTQQDVLRAL